MLSLRTTRYSVVVLFAAAVPLSYAQASRGSGADPAGNIVALDPRWMMAFDTAADAPAGFDQEAAYVPLNGSELVAVALDDGAIRWRVAVGTPFTPATGDGLVFAGAERVVTALDQRSGQTLWQTTLPDALSSAPYWDSGWVVASTTRGELLAHRADDGRVAWRAALGAALSVRPSVSGELLFVALDDGRLAAVHLDSGETRWELALGDRATGLLALEEQLLVGTRGNRLHSVSPDRGRIRWSQRAGADVMGAAVADDELIFFVAFDNVLRALNRGNGNLRWTRNLPSRPSGGPLRANDVVLVPLSTTAIGAYASATGAPAFTIEAGLGPAGIPFGAPFLRDNVRPTAPRLVTMTRDGALQGFAPRIEPPPAPVGELPGVKVGG